MSGSLPATLFEYHETPIISSGYSQWADEKTAYAKIITICRAMAEAKFGTIDSLHNHLIRKYLKSFETLYKLGEGRFTYAPVKPDVVRRYIEFMRRIVRNLLRSTATASICPCCAIGQWSTAYPHRDSSHEIRQVPLTHLERILPQRAAKQFVPQPHLVGVDYVGLAVVSDLPRK
jgi:hypothetical protein